MVEKILNIIRISMKVIVHTLTFMIFTLSIAYWTDGSRLEAIPLLVVSSIIYFSVLKDHSEDYIRSIFRKWEMESLCMITAYMITLCIILFGIVISARIC